MGLANGSRSANKSIHADVFLSFIFGLLITPFLLLLLLLASDDDEAVEPGTFLRKSNVKIFDDDCVAIGLQPFAALLKMSSKQSVSIGSAVDKSSKSRMVESSTLAFFSLVAFSLASDFDDVDSSVVFFADFSAKFSFSDDFTSSSKSSCNLIAENELQNLVSIHVIRE